MKTKTVRILSVLAGVSILVFLLIGDLLAVLSDSDTGAVAFEYSDADVDIKLTVSPSTGTVTVEPGQPFDLDISVESVGAKESFLLLELDVPVITSTTSGEAQDVELFTFNIDTTSWFSVDDKYVTTDAGEQYHSYIYGYGTVADTLDEFVFGVTVSDIITNTVFYDFSHGFNWTGEMSIKAYAIQETGYESMTPSAVWSAVVELQGE